ncbi:MAG: uncharacterized protein KVP18_002908 [Porospora cf. gigantea A]|uniref:uncharacterized protein n=1 Tax=Porospora cf. gigantea A TaxID=2853593 RepID=UPI00355AACDD|nr:MAG: hypothetical protein KVP18_002908 [Porospora cf. gigantea A]
MRPLYLVTAALSSEIFDYAALHLDVRRDLSSLAASLLSEGKSPNQFFQQGLLARFEDLPESVQVDLIDYYRHSYKPTLGQNKWQKRVFDPDFGANDPSSPLWNKSFGNREFTGADFNLDPRLLIDERGLMAAALKDPYFDTNSAFTALFTELTEHFVSVKYQMKRFSYLERTTADLFKSSSEDAVRLMAHELRKRGVFDWVEV